MEWYLPACLLSWYLAFFAVYLPLRGQIWPLHKRPWLVPAFLQTQSTCQLALFLPQESTSIACQHCCISAPTAGPGQEMNRDASVLRRRLQSLFEEADKSLLQRLVADALDILVQRRQRAGSARETIISLPLLMRQLERLLTIGMSMALQSRITALRTSGFHAMLDEARWFLTGKKETHGDPNEWMDRESPLLQEQRAEICRPVSLEVMQMAMLSLASQMPECDHSLTCTALRHRGLIEVASQGDCSCFWTSDCPKADRQTVSGSMVTPRDVGPVPGTELSDTLGDRSYLSRPRIPVEGVPKGLQRTRMARRTRGAAPACRLGSCCPRSSAWHAT